MLSCKVKFSYFEIELSFFLRDIVRENIRLKKKFEMRDEDSVSEKCLEDIKRIAEGKKVYRFDTES